MCQVCKPVSDNPSNKKSTRLPHSRAPKIFDEGVRASVANDSGYCDNCSTGHYVLDVVWIAIVHGVARPTTICSFLKAVPWLKIDIRQSLQLAHLLRTQVSEVADIFCRLDLLLRFPTSKSEHFLGRLGLWPGEGVGRAYCFPSVCSLGSRPPMSPAMYFYLYVNDDPSLVAAKHVCAGPFAAEHPACNFRRCWPSAAV